MNRRLLGLLFICLFGAISSLLLYSISPKEAIGQLFFVILGVSVYGLVQFTPRRLLLRVSPLLYGVIALLLLFIVFGGHRAKGANRWIAIGPVRVQVSELAKPILALSLTTFVLRFPPNRQKHIALFAAIALLPIVLVFIEPDLGSSMVLAAIAGGILYASVSDFSLLLPWCILGGITLALSWTLFLRPYQRERLLSFFGKGSSDATSYNARQSVITVGSGKTFGRGIGHGVLTRLRFLPEHHTDFFFASYAEETGFLGVLLLLLLFLALFLLLWWDLSMLTFFDQVFRVGLLFGIGIQSVVHILMNMGVIPITGIPLPFLSSGGSSFVSLALFLGLSMRFSKQSEVGEIQSIGLAKKTRRRMSHKLSQVGL